MTSAAPLPRNGAHAAGVNRRLRRFRGGIVASRWPGNLFPACADAQKRRRRLNRWCRLAVGNFVKTTDRHPSTEMSAQTSAHGRMKAPSRATRASGEMSRSR